MTAKIVVFGASGYTGRLVVASLLARGVQPVLAGRRAAALQALAAPHGLAWYTADVTDPATVRALVETGDVLVSTVGPFTRFGEAAAAAAADAGAHYVDSTGEVDFVQRLQEQVSSKAAGSGATMVPAFGYDYVPGFLAGALAAQAAGTPGGHLRIGYFALGSLRRGISGGTRATLAEALTRPASVYHSGSLRTRRMGSARYEFRVQGRGRQAFLAMGTEVLFLPQTYPGLAAVEVYNGWFPALSRVAGPLTRAAGALQRLPGGRKALAKAAMLGGAPGGGPDEGERSGSGSYAVANLSDSRGYTAVEVHVQGPNVYTLTGELLAEAAVALRDGHAAASGVQGPVGAFGLPGLTALSARAGLRVV
ncbi:saccharopine dehydrogenase NADP-binding domain-containing protein [Arthrobacter gandavensis]|uniref:saccharopine dehydrogenase family protein n=1 Tax=Arthrobacter gandavensis TaxID=169960 RepID=UPI00188ECA90|nr:saccharopine dehydrogenase NADP-binding domain-containing protein [Arthrobacter gandavensis]MBF4995397.1 saccharopine dehydrogenase NADP-binding domain-containing protein [Arthrobacter gandavensis]